MSLLVVIFIVFYMNYQYYKIKEINHMQEKAILLEINKIFLEKKQLREVTDMLKYLD